MALSEKAKKVAFIVEGVIGVYAALTGRWNLFTIDAVAAVVTAALPTSRSSKEK